MAILAGCQEGKVTPMLMEVKCPGCGSLLEIFVRMGGDLHQTGRLVVDSPCGKCGFNAAEGTSASSYELYK